MLVKQAISPQYPIGAGAPIMVVGGGGNRGGGPRGRTLRQRAGGALGGLVGVAGALTGQHRSLGGLTQSMISGGAQGRALGEALGRKFVGKRGQARADLREASKQADARLAAEHKEQFGASGFRNKPLADQRRAYLRNVAVRQSEEKQRAKQEQMAREAHARTYGGQMGAEDKADIESIRNLREMFGGENPFDTARKVKVVQSASQGTPPPADFEYTPSAPLQLGAPYTPASNPDLTATGELNHPISPDQVDGDTENEPSDNMTQTPQSNASTLPQNEVKVMNTPEQIGAAERMARRMKTGDMPTGQ